MRWVALACLLAGCGRLGFDPFGEGSDGIDGALVDGVVDDPVMRQQAYIKASNTGMYDGFGVAVALSGDTLVVAAASEESAATGIDGNQADDSLPSAGAVYVFRWTGTAWAQEAYLKASNTGGMDSFGISVAIDGDLLVVGASHEASSATGVDGDQADNTVVLAGAAYVFRRTGTTWVQEAYLKASNTGSLDHFGWSVAVSGDTIAVGARGERSKATGIDGDQADDSMLNAGAVYVFRKGLSQWAQEAYIKASNTDSGDEFFDLALSGDTLVVGARGEQSNATGVDGDQANNSIAEAGAAYVFERTDTTWSQRAYLKAPTQGLAAFGGAVAIDGSTVAVAATATNSVRGAVYVFERTGDTWAQGAMLEAPNGEASDSFGSSLALAGGTLVVGAIGEDSGATGLDGDGSDNSVDSAGAAYVFRRDGTTWSSPRYLKASNTGAGDRFGGAVAAGPGRVAVGATSEGSSAVGIDGDQLDESFEAAGAVYVFAP